MSQYGEQNESHSIIELLAYSQSNQSLQIKIAKLIFVQNDSFVFQSQIENSLIFKTYNLKVQKDLIQIMDQNSDTIKCPISDHTNDVKLVCFNEFCKAHKLYCMQCMRIGVHVSHLQYQQELSILFEHIESIEKECEDLITKLNQQMIWLINTSILQLEESDRNTRDLNNNSLIQIPIKKILSFSESIKFKQYEQNVQIQIEKSITDFQDQMEKLLSDLKLSELNYYQISNLIINKSEELYKKGYKLNCNDKYEEAIQVVDQALNFNPKPKLSLWCKASILKQLGQYNEAIIWADKASQVDPKDSYIIFTKGTLVLQFEGNSLLSQRIQKFKSFERV
ncbi:unnamed protein product (macronuclear) [Paramecium tetraurelia]|uniref:Uncharacterized protein n=1 Tax=Paramecium tetraurelia TaxID=5888 RepID=A0CUT9_PARTE|nr:uncharacterized protein GSPATT00039008001 [Paramecium tetraurelia]CAK74556.1 unnamed protein product [Paramecium tetraurelia]|eukprot:XP_001441953.1 hypothetical protein (macronuclear) [Paramecium tetraurelia strain d4-2]